MGTLEPAIGPGVRENAFTHIQSGARGGLLEPLPPPWLVFPTLGKDGQCSMSNIGTPQLTTSTQFPVKWSLTGQSQ